MEIYHLHIKYHRPIPSCLEQALYDIVQRKFSLEELCSHFCQQYGVDMSESSGRWHMEFMSKLYHEFRNKGIVKVYRPAITQILVENIGQDRVLAYSFCSPKDTFSKKAGIRSAMTYALEAFREHANVHEITEFGECDGQYHKHRSVAWDGTVLAEEGEPIIGMLKGSRPTELWKKCGFWPKERKQVGVKKTWKIQDGWSPGVKKVRTLVSEEPIYDDCYVSFDQSGMPTHKAEFLNDHVLEEEQEDQLKKSRLFWFEPDSDEFPDPDVAGARGKLLSTNSLIAHKNGSYEFLNGDYLDKTASQMIESLFDASREFGVSIPVYKEKK